MGWESPGERCHVSHSRRPGLSEARSDNGVISGNGQTNEQISGHHGVTKTVRWESTPENDPHLT